MKIYRTRRGTVLQEEDRFYHLPHANLNEVFNTPDIVQAFRRRLATASLVAEPAEDELLAPIGDQEVWASGVTYLRSKSARMEESKAAGGGDFYDRVYDAERPELFYKASPHRVAGPGQFVRIRKDSRWSVPEPELALAVNRDGDIVGYTVGNDMSARDIEGENPLYLPQAKVYDQSCSLGPCILMRSEPLDPATQILLSIDRKGKRVFEGDTEISQIKRKFEDLVDFLYRDHSFPAGCFLLTGTGIVPPDDFSLEPGDRIAITIAPVGTLINEVVRIEN